MKTIIFLILFLLSIFQTTSLEIPHTNVNPYETDEQLANQIADLFKEVSVLRENDIKTKEHVLGLENTISRQRKEMSALREHCINAAEGEYSIEKPYLNANNLSGNGVDPISRDDEEYEESLFKRFVFVPRSTTSVAFYAYMSSAETSPGRHHTVIFNSVVANIGHAYNAYTGIFSAPASGLYVFSYSVTPSSGAYIPVEIVRNNGAIGSSFTRAYSIYQENASSTVVVQLSIGDVVFIRTSSSTTPSGDIFSNTYARTSFCGWHLV